MGKCNSGLESPSKRSSCFVSSKGGLVGNSLSHKPNRGGVLQLRGNLVRGANPRLGMGGRLRKREHRDARLAAELDAGSPGGQEGAGWGDGEAHAHCSNFSNALTHYETRAIALNSLLSSRALGLVGARPGAARRRWQPAEGARAPRVRLLRAVCARSHEIGRRARPLRAAHVRRRSQGPVACRFCAE